MSVELAEALYGKQDIRVLLVGGTEVIEATMTILVRGGPEESYLDGDNSRVVTTDTLREVAVGALVGATAPEDAALAVTGALRGHYPWLTGVEAEVELAPWARVSGNGFSRGDGSHQAISTSSGILSRWEMRVFLTRGSRFTGFVQDARTPNVPVADRALAGDLIVEWAGEADRAAVRTAVFGAFGGLRSESVQHLLTLMAHAVLAENPHLRYVALEMNGMALSLAYGGAYVMSAAPRARTRVALRRKGDVW